MLFDVLYLGLISMNMLNIFEKDVLNTSKKYILSMFGKYVLSMPIFSETVHLKYVLSTYSGHEMYIFWMYHTFALYVLVMF
jgi:hypothetical protein